MTLFKKIIKHVVVLITMATLALGLVSSTTMAQNLTSGLPNAGELCEDGRGRVISCNSTDLAELAGNIAGVMTFVIVSIAIIFIVYGAFVWMTDIKEGPTKGRKIITAAVVALVISVVAYGVVASLITFLDTNTINGSGTGTSTTRTVNN